jgi:hypothetical protein
MASDRLRTLASLNYKNPRAVLLEMRKVELAIAPADIDARVRHLRTNDLRNVRELRAASLFCYGMSECMGMPMLVAHTEAQDYDAVVTWVRDGTQSFAPIQLKEVVPSELNPTASVQEVINRLTKYTDSPDLTVAIQLNRVISFTPGDLDIPPLRLAAIWIFCAISSDQSKWAIWGNFLDEVECGEFTYPADA